MKNLIMGNEVDLDQSKDGRYYDFFNKHEELQMTANRMKSLAKLYPDMTIAFKADGVWTYSNGLDEPTTYSSLTELALKEWKWHVMNNGF